MLAVEVLVIGAGPAGMAAAKTIGERRPDSDVLLIDAGRRLETRYCPVDNDYPCRGCGGICNVVSGLGGAIHCGDGLKLGDFPAGRRLEELLGDRSGAVMAEAIGVMADLFGHPAEFRISDKRPGDITGLRPYPVAVLSEAMVKAGLERANDYFSGSGNIRYWHSTRATSIEETDDGFAVTVQRSHAADTVIKARYLLCSPGRAGLWWFHDQIRKLCIRATMPRSSVGLRFETQASFLRQAAERHSDFKVSMPHTDGKTKSFCFCAGPAGGRIKFVDYGACVLLDGHVAVDHDHAQAAGGRMPANFALLEQLPHFDDEATSHLEALTERFIDPYRALRPERPGKPVCQSFGDFRNRRTPEADWEELKGTLPFAPSANDLATAPLHSLFDDRMHRNMVSAFDMFWRAVARDENGDVPEPDEAVLVLGLELEGLWDVLDLTPQMESSIRNLFVAGDSTGMAQGVLQAAAGGVSAALEIMRRQENGRPARRIELRDAIVYDQYWTKGQHLEPSETVRAMIADLNAVNGHAPFVADLGCGIGRHAIHALDQGCRVLAVDHHSRAIERLRAFVEERPDWPGRLDAVCGDMLDSVDPALGGEALDGIVLFDCIHHVTSDANDIARKLERLCATLRLGGGIVISLLTDIDYGAGDLPHRRLLLTSTVGDAFLDACFEGFDCVTRKSTDVHFDTTNYCSESGNFIDTYYSATRLIRYYRKRSAPQ